MTRRFRLTLTAVATLLMALLAGLVASGSASRANTALAKAAAQTYKLYRTAYRAGSGDIETVHRWSRRWCRALGGCRPTGNTTASQEHLKRMQALLTEAIARTSAGTARAVDQAAARYYVARARRW